MDRFIYNQFQKYGVDLEESERNLERFAPYFLKAKAELVSGLVNGPDILDAGCGEGRIAVALAEKGFRVTGVDCNAAFIRTARRRARRLGPRAPKFVAGDLRDLPDGRKYDDIILTDVLEHVDDDVGLLRRLGGLLKPGGGIVMIVPAFEALRSPRDAAVGHRRRYRLSELAQKLAAARLRVDRAFYWKLINIPNCLLCRLLGRSEYNYWAARSWFARAFLAWWFENVENRLHLPIGESLVVRAGRNE